MQRFEEPVQNLRGDILALSPMLVMVAGTNTPATIFTDAAGQQVIADPRTDKTGVFAFYAPNGRYDVYAVVNGQRVGHKLDYLLDDPVDANADQSAAIDAAQADVNALQLADYAALRTYAGPRKSVYITGYLAAAAPSGIAGMFVRDDHDTTSLDNGGTIIVANNGIRWKRRFESAVNVMWFGARGDGAADDTAAFQAAVDCLQSQSAGYSTPFVTVTAPQKTFKIGGTINIAFNNNVMQICFETEGAQLVGAGTNTCFNFSNGGYRNIFRKITFTNFGKAIAWSTNNRNECQLRIEGCTSGTNDVFLDTVSYAASRSSMIHISDMLVVDTRVMVNHYTDQMTVENCWLYARAGSDDALLYLSGDGNVHIRDTFLIANGNSTGRWIDFVSDPANGSAGDRSLKTLKLSNVRQSLEASRRLIWTYDTCPAKPDGSNQISSITLEDMYAGGTGGGACVRYQQGYPGSVSFRNCKVLASPLCYIDAGNTNPPVPSVPGAITSHVIMIDEATRLSQSNSNNASMLVDPKLEPFVYDTTTQTSKYKTSIQKNIDYRLKAVSAPGAGTYVVKATIPVFFDTSPAVANRDILSFLLVTVGDGGAQAYSNPTYRATTVSLVTIVGGDNGGPKKRIVTTVLQDAKGGLSNFTDSSAAPTVFWGQGDTGSADISSGSNSGTEDYITVAWGSTSKDTAWAYIVPLAGIRANQQDKQQFGVW